MVRAAPVFQVPSVALTAGPTPKPQNQAPEFLSESELAPWLEAARRFKLNTDFDFRDALRKKLEGASGIITLSELLKVMKKDSAGKRSIQAIGDKIILSKILENLDVPQMPLLFATHGDAYSVDVEQFVSGLKTEDNESAYDIVVKPTHLSDGTGLLVLSEKKWVDEKWDGAKLKDHMDKYL